MKTITFASKEEWLNARRGRITGTRLKDIITLRGTGKKIGFYEIVAEKLGLAPDDEDAMERGKRLEEEAIGEFAKVSGKQVDTSLVMWVREDDENIALSPDGVIGNEEAVEVKCLSSARHIEAYLTQKVPKEYEEQVLQYFIVNDELKTLYMVFYDPRLLARPFFFLVIKREDMQEDVDTYLAYERDILSQVEEAVLNISF